MYPDVQMVTIECTETVIKRHKLWLKSVSWPENQGIFIFLYFPNIANEPDIFHGFPP